MGSRYTIGVQSNMRVFDARHPRAHATPQFRIRACMEKAPAAEELGLTRRSVHGVRPKIRRKSRFTLKIVYVFF
jgi:hypothetical protein